MVAARVLALAAVLSDWYGCCEGRTMLLRTMLRPVPAFFFRRMPAVSDFEQLLQSQLQAVQV